MVSWLEVTLSCLVLSFITFLLIVPWLYFMCSVVFQYKSTERTVFGKCLGHVKFWLEMRKCFIILALVRHQGCCLLNDPKSWKEINLIQIKLYTMVVQITATLYWSYTCLIISCLIKIGLINYKTCGCSKTNNPICFCYIYNPDVCILKQEDHHYELNPSFTTIVHMIFFVTCLVLHLFNWNCFMFLCSGEMMFRKQV